MRHHVLLLLPTMVLGCATDPVDELDDDGAVEIDLEGKTDGVSLTGTFELPGGGKAKHDLANLDIRDGHYVRLRCHDAGCATTIAETDRARAFRSSNGKTYVRFERFAWTDFDNRESKQVSVDAYEYRRVTGGLELRKTQTSRWFTLARRTQPQLCASSGGAYDSTRDFDGAQAGTTTHCDCGQTLNTFPSPQFVPGAGGCLLGSGVGESDCDDSHGRYTDDDRDRLGNYCTCPAGTRLGEHGCTDI